MFVTSIGGNRVEYHNETKWMNKRKPNLRTKLRGDHAWANDDNLPWSKKIQVTQVSVPFSPQIKWNILNHQITNILEIHAVSQNK